MEEKQKINCTVENCKYNDCKVKECILKSIIVEPCSTNDKNSFEEQSMCGSFVLDDENV